jgi:hypothetical protein
MKDLSISETLLISEIVSNSKHKYKLYSHGTYFISYQRFTDNSIITLTVHTDLSFTYTVKSKISEESIKISKLKFGILELMNLENCHYLNSYFDN